MKKVLLSMVMAVVAIAMQAAVGDTFTVGNLDYSIETEAAGSTYGEVSVMGTSTEGKTATSLTIPASVSNNSLNYRVTKVDMTAFKGNTTVTAIRIGRYVSFIGQQAFDGCTKLKTVYLPSALTRIRTYAFRGCTSLNAVYCAGITPAQCDVDAFPNGQTMTLYVTKANGGYENYINEPTSSQWKKFAKVAKSVNAYDFRNTDGMILCATAQPTATANGKLCVVGFNSTGSRVEDGKLVPNTSSGTYSTEGLKFNVTSVADSAFCNDTNLKGVDFSKMVYIENVGKYAFSGCTNLTEANVCGKVIDSYAFNGCTALASLTLQQGVTTINSYAVNNCPLITTINIPQSTTSIQGNSFMECTALKAFTVTTGNTSYVAAYDCLYTSDQNTLVRCPEARSGELREAYVLSITSVAPYALYNCKNITKLELPYGVTTIGDRAFMKSGLHSCRIPSSVTTMGNYLFYNCTELTRVLINKKTPPAITSLFFGNGTPKKHLNVPYESIAAYKAASVWGDFEDIIPGSYDILVKTMTEPTGSAWSYAGFSVTSTTPVTVNDVKYAGYASLDVQNPCFKDNATMTVPESVTDRNGNKYCVYRIGSKLFDIVEQGKYTFALKLGNNIEEISEFAFDGITGLNSITWNHGLKIIGKAAFRGTGLSGSIAPTHGLKYLQEQAFANTAITSIRVPSSVTLLGLDFIYGCSQLNTVILNGDWTASVGYDFKGVPFAAQFEVPTDCVEKYKAHNFFQEYPITTGAYDYTYTVGKHRKGITVTSSTPFTMDGKKYDGKAKYVELAYYTTINEDKTWKGENALEITRNNVARKYLITELGERCAYRDLNNYIDLSSMKHLERIGKEAFSENSAYSITIPATVTSIGASMFDHRGKIWADTITCLGTTPPVCDSDIVNEKEYTTYTLAVPRESLEAYKAANIWKKFQKIHAIGGDFKKGDVNGDGTVDIADVNTVINMILNLVPKTDYNGRGDVNGDGDVDIADLNAIINVILGL